MYTSRAIVWRRTADGEFPYEAAADGVDLRIRVNDFPAEPLYTLFADFRPVADLDDWPGAWLRPAPTADQLRAGAEAQLSRGLVDAIVIAHWAHRMCTAPDGQQHVRLPHLPERADLEALLGPALTAAPAGAPFTCEVVLSGDGLELVRRAAADRPTTPS